MTTSNTNIATYRLEILAPDIPPGASPFYGVDEDKRVLSNLPAMLEAVEEDLTDLLPDGYRVIIIKEDDSEEDPHSL